MNEWVGRKAAWDGGGLTEIKEAALADRWRDGGNQGEQTERRAIFRI